ncbi:MAG: MptD family putative ECF transporter S component [Lachnospiraceae bacterium]
MKEQNKLQAKDYINIGIFSAILMVMYLIASVTNLMPASYLFYSPATAFLGAIPYMIIMAKVPKRGAVILFSIVPLLYFLLLAGVEGVIVAAFIVVFSVFAEIILGNDRTSFKRLLISYLIYSCWNAVGGQFRLFVFTDSYLEYAESIGLAAPYVDYLRSHATTISWILIIAGSLLAALLGVLFSRAIFKKHLKKAGVV